MLADSLQRASFSLSEPRGELAECLTQSDTKLDYNLKPIQSHKTGRYQGQNRTKAWNSAEYHNGNNNIIIFLFI